MHIERKFRNHTITILVLLLTLTSGLYLATRTIPRANAITATPATFTNYELAGNEFTVDHSDGVSCPNMATVESQKCYSTQAEPAIRADRDGNFYGSSESVFCVIGGQCGGTYAWKSTDDGAHFTTLALPNTVTVPPTRVGISPAGSDTDIAVAPRRNLSGVFNVYVVSLDSSLASVTVSTSRDGGKSWSIPINPVAASIPVVDRPWIAADGANKVCISYHNIATTGSILVQCSLDGGTTFGPPISAIDSQHLWLLDFNTQIGTLAIDPGNHVIYQVFSGLATETEGLQCLVSCSFGLHAVWVAVMPITGGTFTDYPVFVDPNPQASTNHQFAQVSVDKSGVPYAVWSNDRNVYYSFSADFGKHWSSPVQVDKDPSKTAIFPWSSAGNAGQLDIVWYGSSFTSPGGPATFPHYTLTNQDKSASWQVYFAQNVQATTPGSSFTQVAASGTIHFGDVCEGGIGCGDNNNRDLLDDFGVAASPTTGLAAIIYTSDQFHANPTLEPANTFGSRHCTSDATNTVDCSHTDIAVQTGGSTVNQHPGNFEEDGEDFEETNVSGNGGSPQPREEIDLTNTGTVAINKFDVAIGGLPWTLTWSSTSPIQPGQSVKATSNSVPLGLLLSVGTIYTVTITATMANGTTETHTVNAIYTLGAGLGL